MSPLLPTSLSIIFGAALLAPLACRIFRDRAGWVLSLAPFCAFALYWSEMDTVAGSGAVAYSVQWFGSLGVSFDLRMDGWAALMALLVTGIGGIIVIYAGGYLKGHPQIGRFYLYLLAFMASMAGLVLSDHLIALFIFWELTSITSYLLIGFNHEDKVSRWNALQALLVTGLGAMAMLVGFILIATATGTYRISEINSLPGVLAGSPFYTAIILLVIAGAFTKSAQVPFHFWLPNAMAAPTPVSAYLHSATMVKAGVFLLARLNPALGGSELWAWTLAVTGSLTLLLAVFLGTFQTDLKRILAYTTLAVLGMLTMLLGLGSEIAVKAMVVFLLGHALYKAALFMTAGSVDHEAGTRDVRLLSGLRRAMPLTAAAAGLAALSKSGFPPFIGFLGKEYVYKTGVALEGVSSYFLAAAFVGNLLVMAMALNAGIGPFFGRATSASSLPKAPHEAPLSMWAGPLLLGVTGLAIGLFPGLISNTLVGPAIAAVKGVPVEPLELKLWHGINLPLLISIATVTGGFVAFFFRRIFWKRGSQVLEPVRRFGAEAVYDKLFHATVSFSKAQTRFLQTGRLHDYVFMIVSTTVAFLLWAVIRFGGISFSLDRSEIDILITGLIVIMIAATVVAVTATAYITVLVALGTVGFGIALIFAHYGAPDLAITQLLVETLTVVLFMFVILRLPALKMLSSRMTQVRDAVLASMFGGLISILVLKALNIQFDHAISGRLAAMSYPEAKGKNVVNVILVDFRALDTLGEIVVISVAALGIAALVSAGLKKRKENKV